MKTALIVVDAQNDFMPGGSLAVPNGNLIIPVINQITRCTPFDLIVFTKDSHPKDHLSFASQHDDKKPFDGVVLSGINDTVWPDHCVQDTFGCEINSSIITDIDSVGASRVSVINKGVTRDEISYSGFFDNTGSISTGLDTMLAENKIERVYVCGLAMDYCVFWTAKDAVKLGYDTYIVLDATAPIKPFNDALSELLTWTCEINGKKIMFAMSGGIELC